MGILSKIFIWWDGATFGTSLFTWRRGEQVGTDAQGNRYYRSRNRRKDLPTDGSYTGGERRWVIYEGANDASRVPPEWHGWLHHSYDSLPESHLPPARIWESDHSPNATGTTRAYRPAGALESGGRRARATGDYEAWTPE